GPHEAFAAPSRPELLHALLMTLGAPGDRVVVSASLRPSCRAALAKAGADPVWVHDDGEEVADLLPLLKPKLVVIASPRGGLERLLARCAELDILLVLDESDRFVIGSRAPENPGLAFLAQHADSPNLAVLVGLIHSQAFPDVELALLFSRHPRLMAGLEVAAELSYSRLSCFHQAYYDSLFDELLSFRVNTGAPRAEARPAGGPALSSTMDELLRSPAFARPAPDPDVIRLDFGENELPLPRRLQAGILQGFLEPPQPGGATRPEARRAAADHLRATRLPELKDAQLVLGMGTLPLLFDALRVMARSLGRPPVVLLPLGSYGVFPALVQAAGGKARRLQTRAPGFLATPAEVHDAGAFDALLLTHPANPSGAAYTPDALRELARLASARGAKLIIDEVFGLLADLDGPAPFGQDRWAGLTGPERESLLVLCGASKEFAAGGLRLGLAASADSAWLAAMEDLQLDPLPVSIQVAVSTLFGEPHLLRQEMEAHRAALARRRHRLLEGLRGLGFAVASEGGGLFLFPDAAPLSKDPEALSLDLEAKARVRMNTPSWSGTTSHLRACYAIPEARIDEALQRLKTYFSAARG
ncbi:MAG TPA: aminotransferase class I/II-fold pyridoxal phosphate-dependent enzyme, partial [Holophagaceae bacterium]|nr:aminotransferase class I/II-fold pyridoxal phosphate-dependent enzyme [Holophagaceae bacterium]